MSSEKEEEESLLHGQIGLQDQKMGLPYFCVQNPLCPPAAASARPQVAAAPSLISGFEEYAALTLIGVARIAVVDRLMTGRLERP